MQLSCSSGILCEFPDIKATIASVEKASRTLDRGIKVKNLFVEMRLSPRKDSFNGWAHPELFSVSRGNWRFHKSGWIQMSIGVDCDYIDIARVFAHELRHIAQFNRGHKKYGILTITPLTVDESEDDAYEFEEKVLNLL